MEDYAAKMLLKSDAALREYVTGYTQYRDEAVLAALAELRRRDQPAPEEAELRPRLEAVVSQQQAVAATQPPAETAEAELPRLYSPAGIVVMSIMVSVFVGALLLALNMRKLKRGNAIIGLVAFTVAYIVGEVLLLQWLVSQHLLTPLVALLVDLPLILAYVWWFWPRYVGTYQFQPRNWLPLLGGCILLKMGLAYFLLLNPATAQLVKQQLAQFQGQ